MISVYDMVYNTLKIYPDKSSGTARTLSRIALKNKDLAKLVAEEIAVGLDDFVIGANRKYATNFIVDSAVVDSAALEYDSDTRDTLTLHAFVHIAIRDIVLNPAAVAIAVTSGLMPILPKPNAFSFVRMFTFKVQVDREHGTIYGISAAEQEEHGI